MEPVRRHTFRKLERLVSRHAFESLSREGQTVHRFPVRMVWQQAPLATGFPAATGFSVPKRNFRRAVDRNRIKRLLREAFRKNKAGLYALLTSQGRQLNLLFIYTGRKMPTAGEIEKQLLSSLHHLAEFLRDRPQ